MALLQSLSTVLLISMSLLTTSGAFRIASYNLRYDSKPDNITVQQTLDNLADPLMQPSYLKLTSERPWSTRRIKIAQELLNEGTVLAGRCSHNNTTRPLAECIAGFQEALVRQVRDLAELLGNDWSWVGLALQLSLYTF
jgi:hypothetical protein